MKYEYLKFILGGGKRISVRSINVHNRNVTVLADDIKFGRDAQYLTGVVNGTKFDVYREGVKVIVIDLKGVIAVRISFDRNIDDKLNVVSFTQSDGELIFTVIPEKDVADQDDDYLNLFS